MKLLDDNIIKKLDKEAEYTNTSYMYCEEIVQNDKKKINYKYNINTKDYIPMLSLQIGHIAKQMNISQKTLMNRIALYLNENDHTHLENTHEL